MLGDGGNNHTETLRALVEAGADVNIPDGSGSTPLTLARSRGYRDMVAILEKAGAGHEIDSCFPELLRSSSIRTSSSI